MVIFQGIEQSGGELVIMGEDDLKVARSARQILVEERWDAKSPEWVRVVPVEPGSDGQEIRWRSPRGYEDCANSRAIW